MKNTTHYQATWTRRQFLTATGGLLGVATLAGCGAVMPAADPAESKSTGTTALSQHSTNDR